MSNLSREEEVWIRAWCTYANNQAQDNHANRAVDLFNKRFPSPAPEVSPPETEVGYSSEGRSDVCDHCGGSGGYMGASCSSCGDQS